MALTVFLFRIWSTTNRCSSFWCPIPANNCDGQIILWCSPTSAKTFPGKPYYLFLPLFLLILYIVKHLKTSPSCSLILIIGPLGTFISLKGEFSPTIWYVDHSSQVEVFIVLHWFLPESSGIWAIPRIPEESNLAEGCAKLINDSGRISNGIQISTRIQEWPGRNALEQNPCGNHCLLMTPKSSIIWHCCVVLAVLDNCEWRRNIDVGERSNQWLWKIYFHDWRTIWPCKKSSLPRHVSWGCITTICWEGPDQLWYLSLLLYTFI